MHVVLGVVIHWETTRFVPQEVPDYNADGIAGGFLVLPVIDTQLIRFKGCEQFDRDLLDTLDLLGRELGFLQKVKDGQRFLVKALSTCPGLLVIEFLDELQQGLEGLLDRDSVLFPVVFGHDRFVVPLEVRPQGSVEGAA